MTISGPARCPGGKGQEGSSDPDRIRVESVSGLQPLPCYSQKTWSVALELGNAFFKGSHEILSGKAQAQGSKDHIVPSGNGSQDLFKTHVVDCQRYRIRVPGKGTDYDKTGIPVDGNVSAQKILNVMPLVFPLFLIRWHGIKVPCLSVGYFANLEEFEVPGQCCLGNTVTLFLQQLQERFLGIYTV